jgi:hypothetical protein
VHKLGNPVGSCQRPERSPGVEAGLRGVFGRGKGGAAGSATGHAASAIAACPSQSVLLLSLRLARRGVPSSGATASCENAEGAHRRTLSRPPPHVNTTPSATAAPPPPPHLETLHPIATLDHAHTHELPSRHSAVGTARARQASAGALPSKVQPLVPQATKPETQRHRSSACPVQQRWCWRRSTPAARWRPCLSQAW